MNGRACHRAFCQARCSMKVVADDDSCGDAERSNTLEEALRQQLRRTEQTPGPRDVDTAEQSGIFPMVLDPRGKRTCAFEEYRPCDRLHLNRARQNNRLRKGI